jgi:hypothetical protein
VTDTRLSGSDYTCGEVVIDLRKRAQRYREDPSLRCVEERDQRELSVS